MALRRRPRPRGRVVELCRGRDPAVYESAAGHYATVFEQGGRVELSRRFHLAGR